MVIGCSHQSVTSFDRSKIDSRSAIIFIPGYYGSTLDDDHGDRAFVTAGAILFGGRPLSLENETLATPKAPHLNVGGVLRDVPVIPFVNVNVYGTFIDHLNTLAKTTNSQVISFAYDWRQDLAMSAAQLDALIDELHARGVTRVSLVAHSMGCLVTAYELGYGNQPLDKAQLDWRGAKKITNVVLMAGPFDGVFSIFGNMQRGARLAGNSSMMPKETVASFPAAYDLLPFRRAHVISYSGDQSPIALGDATYWREHQLGLLWNKKMPSEIYARREAYTTKQIESASRFSDLIHFDGAQAPAALRVLTLVGHGQKTIETGFYDAKTGNYLFVGDNLSHHKLDEKALLGDGDGTVLVTSAQPPAALLSHAKMMSTTQSHVRIFEDKGFLKELDSFLQ